MLISRCYLEITNICNLDCAFCPKHKRKKGRLEWEDFELLTDRLRGNVKFLYFHLMGEPFLHPLLPRFVRRAREKGFVPVLTTNGTLCSQPRAMEVIDALPHKIQISLHSQEANESVCKDDAPTFAEDYIDGVMQFALAAQEKGVIVVLRLWNQGGYDKCNDLLIKQLERYIPRPWKERYDGFKLSEKIYLEYDNMFEWPDEERDAYTDTEVFCYALRNQFGVLVDGSVVPCCLDHEGTVTLGNLFEQSLEEALRSPRAVAMYEGFTNHKATEPLCQRCGYASVAKRFRK